LAAAATATAAAILLPNRSATYRVLRVLRQSGGTVGGRSTAFSGRRHQRASGARVAWVGSA